MDTAALLAIARETIAKVPFCFAITVGEDGEASADRSGGEAPR
jgi:predicted pyridoxine 5'-phosphate oxidase superfamily flavin-nucleotide-binding protein